MQWTIPGTVLTGQREEAAEIRNNFQSMFLGGGIMLSQVTAITGLEPYDVQNWVKRRLLPAPTGKRYDLNQLCRIININMLKKVLHMEQIIGLLTYINGDLDDHSDDLIDDSKLYFMFVELAAKMRTLHGPDSWDAVYNQALANYNEPIPGARDRVQQVLKIMLTAWAAAQFQLNAEKMISDL